MDRESTQMRELSPPTVAAAGNHDQVANSAASFPLCTFVAETGSTPDDVWETVRGGGAVAPFEAISCSFEPVHEPIFDFVLAAPAIIWLAAFVVCRRFTLRSLFLLTFCYAIVMAMYGLR